MYDVRFGCVMLYQCCGLKFFCQFRIKEKENKGRI